MPSDIWLVASLGASFGPRRHLLLHRFCFQDALLITFRTVGARSTNLVLSLVAPARLGPESTAGNFAVGPGTPLSPDFILARHRFGRGAAAPRTPRGGCS